MFPEHHPCDFIGHVVEALIPLFAGHVSIADDAVQKDLDVDFVVRAVDAGGIVDGIRVDPASVLRELDSSRLRAAEIAAFSDDLAAQFVSVHPQRIIRPVVHFCMGFGARLDIGSNSPVPEQIDLRNEHGANQIVWADLLPGNSEALTNLLRKRN